MCQASFYVPTRAEVRAATAVIATEQAELGSHTDKPWMPGALRTPLIRSPLHSGIDNGTLRTLAALPLMFTEPHQRPTIERAGHVSH